MPVRCDVAALHDDHGVAGIVDAVGDLDRRHAGKDQHLAAAARRG